MFSEAAHPGGVDVGGGRIACLLAQVDNVGVVGDHVSVAVPGHHLGRARHADTLLGLNVPGHEVLDLLVLVLHLLKRGGHVVQVGHQVVRGLVHVHVRRNSLSLDLSVSYLWNSPFVQIIYNPKNLKLNHC